MTFSWTSGTKGLKLISTLLLYFTKISYKKSYKVPKSYKYNEKVLLFHLKCSFRYQDIQIFVIFLLFCRTFYGIIGIIMRGIIMRSWNGLHRLSIVIYWITQEPSLIQEPSWIKASKLARWWITRKFLSIFENMTGTSNHFQTIFFDNDVYKERLIRKQQ